MDGSLGALYLQQLFNGLTVGTFTLPFVGGVELNHVHIGTVPVLGDVRLGQVLTLVGLERKHFAELEGRFRESLLAVE